MRSQPSQFADGLHMALGPESASESPRDLIKTTDSDSEGLGRPAQAPRG